MKGRTFWTVPISTAGFDDSRLDGRECSVADIPRQTSMEDSGQSKKLVEGRKKQCPIGPSLWGTIHGALTRSAVSRGHRVGRALRREAQKKDMVVIEPRIKDRSNLVTWKGNSPWWRALIVLY